MNRSTASFLLLGGLVAAYYGTLGRSHLAAIEAHHRAIDAAYQRQAAAEDGTRQLQSLQQAGDELAQWHGRLGARLTRAADAAPPMLTLANELKADGLTVDHADAMSPDSRIERPNQRVRVTVTGSFANLFVAVRDLENAALPTRVTDLTLHTAADGRTVHAELVIAQTWNADR